MSCTHFTRELAEVAFCLCGPMAAGRGTIMHTLFGEAKGQLFDTNYCATAAVNADDFESQPSGEDYLGRGGESSMPFLRGLRFICRP